MQSSFKKQNLWKNTKRSIEGLNIVKVKNFDGLKVLLFLRIFLLKLIMINGNFFIDIQTGNYEIFTVIYFH